LLHHHARIDGSTVDGAVEQLSQFQHPVAVVEIETTKALVWQVRHLQTQIGFRVGRTAQHAAAMVTGCEDAHGKAYHGFSFPITKRRDTDTGESIAAFWLLIFAVRIVVDPHGWSPGNVRADQPLAGDESPAGWKVARRKCSRPWLELSDLRFD